MLKVGVAGVTGYSGEEAIKILLNHAGVTITEVSAFSAVAEKEVPLSVLAPAYKGRLDILCKKTDPDAMAKNVDLVFLGLPHKISMDVAPVFLKAGKRVIDLSADYRLDAAVYEKYYGTPHKDKANLSVAVYGLPELNREKIKAAKLIANPGCYPTSVILGIAPMLKEGAINTADIIVDSKSGTTGAGKKADQSLLFSEINENLKAYKVNDHQHMPEINRVLSGVAGKEIGIVFTPHLIPMSRGIFSTIYMKLTKSLSLTVSREFSVGSIVIPGIAT
jgi:N-acetyl-gamma-glutamyl-phosphate reductase, common form